MSIAQKLTTLAENEQKVYEAGKQAYEDWFWDIYQNKGLRTDYKGAFSGDGWTNETFKPVYDMKPVDMFSMFNGCNVEGELPKILDNFGVSIDMSECNTFTYTFASTQFTRLGVIDLTNATNMSSGLSSSRLLETIDEFRLNDSGKCTFANTFTYLTALKNITVTGVIGKDWNMQWSDNLTAESIKSIINALKNYSGTDEAKVYKLTFSAKAWNTIEATTPPEGYETWKDYVSSGLGWNV